MQNPSWAKGLGRAGGKSDVLAHYLLLVVAQQCAAGIGQVSGAFGAMLALATNRRFATARVGLKSTGSDLWPGAQYSHQNRVRDGCELSHR